MTKILYFVAAAIIAAPVAAQSGQVQPIQTNTKKSDVNKLVCKTEDSIGSRLGNKKVCLTTQEWKERADFYRDQTESWQRQAPARSSGG